MPRPQDIIVHSLSAAQMMLHRFVDDLKPEEFLHRPCLEANCAAWIVGHLAASDRKALAGFGVPLPEVPAGFEERFAAKGAGAKTSNFGDSKELVRLFDAHRSLLIEQAKKADDLALAGPPAMQSPLFSTRGELLNFLGLHAAMHLGQISTIRRSLGRPPIV